MDVATLFRDLCLVALAYLCGSVPVGVLVAQGIGRAGSPDGRLRTNRRHQRPAGAWQALGARRRRRRSGEGRAARADRPRLTNGDPIVEVACGLAAVIGSARSVFLGFGGGRGVATGVGTMLVLEPAAVLLAAPVSSSRSS